MSALATIHVGLKALGIDQDDARDLYERQTAKRSLREMSPDDHKAVLGELRRLGFNHASKGSRKRLEGRFAKKLQALWIAAWNLGIVRNREDAALLAFVQRQTGLDHVRFLHDPADARKAIEALKGWMTREAGVDWHRTHGRDWFASEQAKIAWAQFYKVVPGATPMGNERMFEAMICQLLGVEAVDLAAITPLQWQAVMNQLGERVRKAVA